MVTSTVFFSCLEGTSTALCQGRRNRKVSRINFGQIEENEAYSALEGSQIDMAREARDLKDPENSEDDPADASSKLLGINVWTRVRTTTTVTMLYTDTNTTIRLSYACQAGHLQLPQFGCGPTPP
ncbi:hypothetical protein E2C01_043983 [Portunus trituberculatus]|uniref:Uncharacterized protein n=2 Tax=Portunus trituberculatus TaxID=210409 RepID=A0A5B7FQV2_PORTR|nr:hypothetical protein [Portunus trituberculatus]